jgi:hypothetical protein
MSDTPWVNTVLVNKAAPVTKLLVACGAGSPS